MNKRSFIGKIATAVTGLLGLIALKPREKRPVFTVDGALHLHSFDFVNNRRLYRTWRWVYTENGDYFPVGPEFFSSKPVVEWTNEERRIESEKCEAFPLSIGFEPTPNASMFMHFRLKQ